MNSMRHDTREEGRNSQQAIQDMRSSHGTTTPKRTQPQRPVAFANKSIINHGQSDDCITIRQNRDVESSECRSIRKRNTRRETSINQSLTIEQLTTGSKVAVLSSSF